MRRVGFVPVRFGRAGAGGGGETGGGCGADGRDEGGFGARFGGEVLGIEEAEETERERLRRRGVPALERGVGAEEEGVEPPEPLVHLLPPVLRAGGGGGIGDGGGGRLPLHFGGFGDLGFSVSFPLFCG